MTFGVVSLSADMVYEGARSILGSYLAILGASAAVAGFASGAGEFAGYGLRALTGNATERLAEVEQQRRAIEHELGRTPTARTLTKNEIRALIGRLKEISEVRADPEDKRAVYAELGVNLTYSPDGTVLAKAGAPQADASTNDGVGGATRTPIANTGPSTFKNTSGGVEWGPK